jgi:hypothetical protein
LVTCNKNVLCLYYSCHSCASRNPVDSVFLDSRFCGNDETEDIYYTVLNSLEIRRNSKLKALNSELKIKNSEIRIRT